MKYLIQFLLISPCLMLISNIGNADSDLLISDLGLSDVFVFSNASEIAAHGDAYSLIFFDEAGYSSPFAKTEEVDKKSTEQFYKRHKNFNNRIPHCRLSLLKPKSMDANLQSLGPWKVKSTLADGTTSSWEVNGHKVYQTKNQKGVFFEFESVNSKRGARIYLSGECSANGSHTPLSVGLLAKMLRTEITVNPKTEVPAPAARDSSAAPVDTTIQNSKQAPH